MSGLDSTCRTCGKGSESDDGSDLFSLYNSGEYETELKMTLEEFEIWNLDITEDDGLPQKICLTCFDSFCQIHNFRVMCLEAQANFGELCTGLDIIIKIDPDIGDQLDSIENNSGDETFIVQEHFKFPGDDCKKVVNTPQETDETNVNSGETLNSDEENQKEEECEDKIQEVNATLSQFKSYRCEFCMDVVSYEDPEQLNEHINNLHSTELPFPCPKCEKCFNTKAKRNSHARIHFRMCTKCDKCNRKIRGSHRMVAQHHEFYHIEKDRQCPTCGKKFQNISLKRFKYHMHWHDDTKLHKCKYCDKKFIQTTHLAIHERTHTGECPFMCSECGMKFRNSNVLYNHMELHGMKGLDCPKCPKKFFNESGLRLHIKTHNATRQSRHCEICNKTYRSLMNLRLHNHRHHGGPASESMLRVLQKQQIKIPLIKPYACDKCPEAYVLHTQLIKHLKIHDEYRPYKCKLCGKAFKRDAHLRLHMDSLHYNRKPHKCTICGWAFPQKTSLAEHMVAKHGDGKRDFKCDICSNDFLTHKSLRIHMLKHSNDKPFICTVCNKGFKQLCVLRKHMNRHLLKNEVVVKTEDITEVII